MNRSPHLKPFETIFKKNKKVKEETMFANKKLAILVVLMMVAPIVLAACGPTPPPETVVQEVVKTVEVERTVIVEGTPQTIIEKETVIEEVVVTATPEPVVEGPKTLVICQGQEPDTMYIYGGSMLAASHIQNAMFDGPFDNRSFGYQAVIFEKLPTLDDGDAVINTVTVGEGDVVVDSLGNPVELTAEFTGTIRPAGCYTDECAVAYGGGELEMEQMQVTFVLKDGLTWADGEPVKASDSVYAFNLYMDPDTPSPTRYVGEHTATYEATDDKTLVWTGLPGYRDATYFINAWTPQPEHLWGSMSAADIVSSEEASRTPIGYGAFTSKEWVAGDHFTVVKNPYYFRADEGLPYVDEIVFRFIGEDPNAAIAALLAGECDILTQDVHMDDQAELLIELEQAGQLIPTFVTGTVWEHVDFGINPVEEYAATRPDFFEDLRMRQAIAMCLDRQAVVDELLLGKSVVIHSYIPSEHPVYNPDVKQYPYDTEAAKALLEEMGWVDTDGDGIRECSGCGVEGATDGTKLAFKWGSTNADLRINYMQIFQVNLLDCGIDLTLENLTAGEWFADGPEGPLFGRHFDLGSFAWLTGVEPPCDLYLGTQWPSEESGWAGQNDPGFADAEYDKVCNSALQSLPGTAEYEQYHKEAQRIFAEQLPVIPLFLRTKLAAYAPNVTGFIMDPTVNSETWNIESFNIER
jgi:peptide/nickel transport system substrate-binding protein